MITETATVLASHRGDEEFFFPFFLFLILGIAAFVFFRRRRGGPSHWGRQNAKAVLDERFANGDIDRAEYEHRKAVLDGKDDIPPAPPRTATAVADPPPNRAADDTPADES